MASLFQGDAPPNVETFRETAAKAPDYLTTYLQDVAKAGTTALAKPADSLVAPLSSLQTQAITAAPTALTRYQTPMDAALTAGQAGAGVDQADITKFYNPYQKAVSEDMATRSALNVQRNLLPQLKAGFVGTGGIGGQRYAGALGQTLGDVETSLLQEQNKAQMATYQSAIDAALREMSGQTQAGQMLGTLGAQEQQAATTGLKSAADIGAIEQAQQQAEINAPLTQATNVAALMRGYTYPTVTTETYKGPASSYGPSILSQIGGLGSLIASGTNSKDTGWLDKLGNKVSWALSGGVGNITPGNPDYNTEGSVQGGEFGST